jgi:hypothetical protein
MHPTLDAAIEIEGQKLEQTINFTSASKRAGNHGDSALDKRPEQLKLFDEITSTPGWLDGDIKDNVEPPEVIESLEEELIEVALDAVQEESPLKNTYSKSMPELVVPRPRHLFRLRNAPPIDRKRVPKKVKAVKCDSKIRPAILNVSTSKFLELVEQKKVRICFIKY